MRWAVSDFEAQMSGRKVGFFLSESGWKLGRVASSKDTCGFHDPLHPAWRLMLALWTGYAMMPLASALGKNLLKCYSLLLLSR